MPLIIESADYDRWLSAEDPPVNLRRPYPTEKMAVCEIGQQINKRGHDVPDIVDPRASQGRGPGRARVAL
jgi:putative SOS response-associated peptidase YedK